MHILTRRGYSEGMENNTYTTEQIAYAEGLTTRFMADPRNANFTDRNSIMEMALISAVEKFAVRTHSTQPEYVIRTYKCNECGTRAERTVHPDWEAERTDKGLQPSNWSCDDCGEEYWHDIRITKKD